MAFPGKTTISNTTLTSANTEYSYVLPELTFKFQIKARSTTVVVKYAFVSGESGSNYMSIPANMTYWDDNICTSSTIYLQSTTAGAVVEIQSWQGA